MAPTRPDYKLNLDGLGPLNMNQARSANTSATNSPLEMPAGSGLRYPLGTSLTGTTSQGSTGRAGAGSPSKEYGSRLFPKRAREIQAQEGLSPQIWGPPTTGSGHSTPLRETIPESPSSDSFPDFDAGGLNTNSVSSAPGSIRRTRAGTVPSRFPGMATLNSSSSQTSLSSKSGLPTPSTSPYPAGTTPSGDGLSGSAQSSLGHAALLSRLRAGSLPQRSGYFGGSSSSRFGNSVFANNWMAGGRDRASTLQSIRSSDGGISPIESPADNDVRTLDYLGLVDTPQPSRGNLSQTDLDLLMSQQQQNGVSIADLAALNAFNNRNTANRFRSYSVNAKEKYADADGDDMDQYEHLQQMYGGQSTPNADSAAAQAALIHEAVRQHNLEVQAFANFASANRPRARTAGVLDSPSSRVLRNYLPTASRLDSSITAADLQNSEESDYTGLTNAVQGMSLNANASYEPGMDPGLEHPTKALWLGNIPSSTTVSSLNVIFSQFGQIEFARVLTHKSCGFVNFDNVQSAMAAKSQCNGKEIFPGCGPIRIGFAKEQSAANTPGANGAYPSPSPDPFVAKGRMDASAAMTPAKGNINAETAAAALVTPDLLTLRDEALSIVQQFGATPDEHVRMAATLDAAINYDGYKSELPPASEPSHSRAHDAPRLREIRKRIDNNSYNPGEIESIAMDMLPEIAELSSDYLGNTVVQKLFEHCAEETKEAMLSKIAPHLAEIGVHKNGTWAAQKIIDVARTRGQMSMIMEALKPHTVALFLDQYGNYVIQCCLRFQSPINNFIFDTMLAKLWDVAQGRFGARAMRACLESHFATNDQKRLMAAAIALHSVQLATNSNGALLLTWFLDTCTFPKRRSVLTPRLIPHLVHLCTHKVAYLTVLKIINQRNESDARDSILRALFFDEQTLTSIVSDQTCGATLIFKVLTTPFLDETLRPECVENVRNVLVRIKAQPTQGYKRLMDEVGLSTRRGGTPVGVEGDAMGKPRNGQVPHLEAPQNGFRASMNNNQQPPPMDQGLQRSVSMDSNGFDPFLSSQYTHSPAMSNAGISPIGPQIQYQQALLAQAQAQAQRPPGFFGAPGMAPAAGMQNGMGYANSSPGPQMMDPFRSGMGASPMAPPGIGMQGGFQQQQAYGAPMMGMNGYNQFQQMPQYFQQQGQMQGQMAGQRRGRR